MRRELSDGQCRHSVGKQFEGLLRVVGECYSVFFLRFEDSW